MSAGEIEPWEKRDSGIRVEAVRLNEENAAAVAAWCGGDLVEEINAEYPDEKSPGINVPTDDGMKRASLGWYVVKFERHYFVVSVRVFELSYKPVSRPAPPPESIGDTRRRLGFGESVDRGRVL